eukprot:Nk52_evm37s153 gene=Nk52_evmTU37s153
MASPSQLPASTPGPEDVNSANGNIGAGLQLDSLLFPAEGGAGAVGSGAGSLEGNTDSITLAGLGGLDNIMGIPLPLDDALGTSSGAVAGVMEESTGSKGQGETTMSMMMKMAEDAEKRQGEITNKDGASVAKGGKGKGGTKAHLKRENPASPTLSNKSAGSNSAGAAGVKPQKLDERQTKQLEVLFQENPTPSSALINEIAERLQASPYKTQVWFQNRRAREKKRQAAAARERAGIAPKKTGVHTPSSALTPELLAEIIGGPQDIPPPGAGKKKAKKAKNEGSGDSGGGTGKISSSNTTTSPLKKKAPTGAGAATNASPQKKAKKDSSGGMSGAQNGMGTKKIGMGGGAGGKESTGTTTSMSTMMAIQATKAAQLMRPVEMKSFDQPYGSVNLSDMQFIDLSRLRAQSQQLDVDYRKLKVIVKSFADGQKIKEQMKREEEMKQMNVAAAEAIGGSKATSGMVKTEPTEQQAPPPPPPAGGPLVGGDSNLLMDVTIIGDDVNNDPVLAMASTTSVGASAANNASTEELKTNAIPGMGEHPNSGGLPSSASQPAQSQEGGLITTVTNTTDSSLGLTMSQPKEEH